MQVFCKATTSGGDIRCNICGQAFELIFQRATATERADARYTIQLALRDQHLGTDDRSAHQPNDFNITLSGSHFGHAAKFSATALLRTAADWAF